MRIHLLNISMSLYAKTNATFSGLRSTWYSTSDFTERFELSEHVIFKSLGKDEHSTSINIKLVFLQTAQEQWSQCQRLSLIFPMQPVKFDNCKLLMAYTSCKLKPSLDHYSTIKKECLGIIWSVKNFNGNLNGK